MDSGALQHTLPQHGKILYDYFSNLINTRSLFSLLWKTEYTKQICRCDIQCNRLPCGAPSLWGPFPVGPPPSGTPSKWGPLPVGPPPSGASSQCRAPRKLAAFPVLLLCLCCPLQEFMKRRQQIVLTGYTCSLSTQCTVVAVIFIL